MKFLGNLLWVILCGFWMALGWFFVGLLWCITIVGIPVGLQCMKFAKLSLFPFGKEISYGGGAGSVIVNILWLFFGGLELALGFLMTGIVFFVTIIGIPFGLQCLKLARLSLTPFGAQITSA